MKLLRATFTSFLRKQVSTLIVEVTVEFGLEMQIPQLLGGL